MLHDPDYHDTILLFNGFQVPCLRAVLTARSDVFKAMFQKTFKEGKANFSCFKNPLFTFQLRMKKTVTVTGYTFYQCRNREFLKFVAFAMKVVWNYAVIHYHVLVTTTRKYVWVVRTKNVQTKWTEDLKQLKSQSPVQTSNVVVELIKRMKWKKMSVKAQDACVTSRVFLALVVHVKIAIIHLERVS